MINEIANNHTKAGLRMITLNQVIDNLTNIIDRQDNLIIDQRRELEFVKDNAKS